MNAGWRRLQKAASRVHEALSWTNRVREGWGNYAEDTSSSDEAELHQEQQTTQLQAPVGKCDLYALVYC